MEIDELIDVNDFYSQVMADDSTYQSYLGLIAIAHARLEADISNRPRAKENLKRGVKAITNSLDKEFQCRRCGNCCHQIQGVQVSSADISHLKDTLKISTEEFKKRYVTKQEGLSHIAVDTSCPFIKNGNCSVYKHRPSICKKFPMKTLQMEMYLAVCIMRGMGDKCVLPSPFRCPGFLSMENKIKNYVNQIVVQTRSD